MLEEHLDILLNQRDRNINTLKTERLTRLTSTRSVLQICILIAWLLPALSVNAGQIYKYVDENGKVHYSDHPFTYRQENFSATDKNSSYNKKANNVKTGNISGHWNLVAHSKHLGNDTMPSNGVWRFTDSGSLRITHGKEINNTEYRAQGNLLEILDERKWKPYRIVSLSDTRLVIHTGERGEYLYFSKSQPGETATQTTRSKPQTLYRRDQVAALISMFSCTGIKFNELNAEEKKDKEKEIFTMTGIEKFDENIYNHSVSQYKKDAIFKDQYLPRINKELENCKVPKFDSN